MPAKDVARNVLLWPMWIGIALFSLTFIVSSPLILGFTLFIGLCSSVISILQSLYHTNRLSADGQLGSILTRILDRTRQVLRVVFSLWAFLALYLVYWPVFLIAILVVPSVFTAANLATRGLSTVVTKVLGESDNTQNLTSLPKAVVCGILAISHRWTSSRRHFRGQLDATWKEAPKPVLSLHALISQATLDAANSKAADFLANLVARIVSSLTKWITSAFGVVYVVVVGISLDTRDPSAGDESLLMLLAIVLPIIPTCLAAVIGPFINAYEEVVTASLLAASASNSTIYEPSELGQEDDSCIRLLKILPGSAGRPVVCKLEVTDLSSLDVPPYEALSYVWGPPDMNEQIEINGHKINVSQVLLQALLHLRSAATPRTLWVDALCINQFDLPERSSQVLLMPLIYSKATRVVLWLGETEPWGLYYAIECAKSLEVSNPRASTSAPDFHFGVAYVAAKLLRRSYWTRVWVVQELVLAKDTLVACGRFTCQWETLHQIVAGSAYHSFFPTNHVYIDEFLALETSHKLRASTQRNTHRDADLKFESALMATDDSRAPDDSRAHDLVSLWYRYRSRKATDPRDKVFAFIGLADSSYDLLQPDYSRRASFLSIELANQHIRYSRTLSVMALAESARVRSQDKPSSTNDYREAYIPSWCPAFMTNDSKAGAEIRLFWTGLPGDERENSHATGHVPVLAVPTQSSAQIGESLDDPEFHFLEIDVVSNFGLTISRDGRLSGHWDELVASSMTAGRRQETTWNWKLAEKLLASNGQGGGSRLTKSSTNDAFAEELIHLTLTAGKFSCRPSLDDDRQHRLYHEAQRQACLGRQLFVTTDGRLGLGPEDLKSGDELHIALGIGAPVILRKTITEWNQSADQVSDIYNSTWLYIGQAYVHDMMNYKGDLTADIDSGRVTLERRKLA